MVILAATRYIHGNISVSFYFRLFLLIWWEEKVARPEISKKISCRFGQVDTMCICFLFHSFASSTSLFNGKVLYVPSPSDAALFLLNTKCKIHLFFSIIILFFL